MHYIGRDHYYRLVLLNDVTPPGSLAWALSAAFSYFYMASAWGGYIFISNVVAIYAFVMVVSRRYVLLALHLLPDTCCLDYVPNARFPQPRVPHRAYTTTTQV